MLPDFMHKFEANLREPSRQLAIKDMVINFDPTTVYGNRSGFLRGILATVTCPRRKLEAKGLLRPHPQNFGYQSYCPEAKAPLGGNCFWKSVAWRRGTVNDVRMCPRSEMWKPVAPLTMQSAMTDIQEAKQASWRECQVPEAF